LGVALKFKTTLMSIQYLLKKSVVVFIQLSLFFSLLCGVAQGETPAWKNIETKYTVIHYQSFEDLKKFNYKVKYGQEQWSLKWLFSGSGPNDLVDGIITKVDVLFERVQEILDMRKKMKKVTINVYRYKEQLHDAYSKIYKGPCRIRAWYRYGNNTVYVHVNDLHEGMLAHELAHSIIDRYLLVRPPAATAEILARYVDSHLKE
jgi:hypothetical protein